MPVLGAIAAIGAVGSAVGGLLGGISQGEANQAAAQTMYQQSKFTKQQTDEQVRRAELQIQQEMGQAKASVGASGFATAGKAGSTNSMNAYVGALGTELEKEKSWLQQAGYQTAEFQREAAYAKTLGADAQIWSGALSGGGSLLSGLANIGKTFNWFGMGQT
jgi:hypothetical protein